MARTDSTGSTKTGCSMPVTSARSRHSCGMTSASAMPTVRRHDVLPARVDRSTLPVSWCRGHQMRRENLRMAQSPRLDLRLGVTEPVVLMISRREVKAGDIESVLSRLKVFLATREDAWRHYYGKTCRSGSIEPAAAHSALTTVGPCWIATRC